MEKDFSWKNNDKKAVAVADKITRRFPEDPKNQTSWSDFCEYLSTVAGLPYADTMSMINGLGELSNAPRDVFRVALALLHCKDDDPGKSKVVKAHARILGVSVSDKQSRFPKIALHLLLVSSKYAGMYLLYQVDLRDAVKLHRSNTLILCTTKIELV